MGVESMLEFNEKVYHRLSRAGAANIIVGILMIVFGITLGTVTIVYGGKVLASKKHLID